MAFQTSVSYKMASGIVGGIYDNSPLRASSYIIGDTTGNAQVGRYFTLDDATNTVKAGGTDATKGVGILANPHGYVNYNGDLSATQVVANGAEGQFVSFGRVYVRVTDATKGNAVYGAAVSYDTTTGELQAGAGGTAIPNAKIITNGTANGLCVVELS